MNDQVLGAIMLILGGAGFLLWLIFTTVYLVQIGKVIRLLREARKKT